MDSSLPGQAIGSDWSRSLTELEKGLKSPAIGDQAGAIADVPLIISVHRFPLFINATVLKLGESFQFTSSNFVRQCLVDVLARCHGDMEDKLISVTEIARKFYTVSFSNDPIARALTLRAVGWLAVPFASSHTIHDLVKRSLDTHHMDELAAAVFASNRYAAVSSDFFAMVFDKVSDILQSMAYSAETKRDLLPIFRFAQLEQLPRIEKHQTELSAYEPELMSDIMTELSLRSVADVSQRISKLLTTLTASGQPFRMVQSAVKALLTMAVKSPHVWETTHFDTMFGTLSDFYDNLNNELSSTAALVASSLLKMMHRVLSSESCLVLLDPSMVLICRHLCAQTVNVPVQLEALKLFSTHASCESATTEVLLHLSHFLAVPNLKPQSLASLLRSVISMANRCGAMPSLLTVLLRDAKTTNGANSSSGLIPALLSCVDHEPALLNRIHKEDFALNVNAGNLCVLAGNADTLAPALRSANLWDLYKLGRCAMRFGKHDVAKEALKRLIIEASASEEKTWWLEGLNHFATGESLLSNTAESTDVILSALNAERSALHFMMAVPSAHFPVAFLRARIALLEAQDQLRLVAEFAGLFSRNDVNEVISLFADARSKFAKLKASCFDADDRTLQTLSLWSRICEIVRARLCFLADGGLDSLSPDSDVESALSEGYANMVLEKKVLTLHKNLSECDDLKAVAGIVLKELNFSVFVPRFFFQRLQTTTVKLAISPSPSDTSQVYRLPADQRLLLKVEGLLEQTFSGRKEEADSEGRYVSPKQPRRKVSRVVVSAHSRFGTVGKFSDADISLFPLLFRKEVDVKHGYFVVESLLSLKETLSIVVTVQFVDDMSGDIWESSAQETLRVQVLQTAPPKQAYTIPIKQRKIVQQ